MEKIIDRFDKYMKFKNLNDNSVTVQLGLSVGLLGKSRKDDRDLSKKAIEAILNFYTDINKVWLLTGEGEMLCENISESQTENSQEKEDESSIIVQQDAKIQRLIKDIALLKENLIERDETIFKLVRSVDRLTELLEGKGKDVVKNKGNALTAKHA